MTQEPETVESSSPAAAAARASVPGLLLVFSAGKPTFGVLPFPREEGGARGLEIGRGQVGTLTLEDDKVSRRHAHVSFDGERWRVRDLGSRNGTWADRRELRGEEWVGTDLAVVRTGESLFAPVPDVGPYVAASVETRGDLIVGPLLGRVLEQARRASASGTTLFINGESGSGKEIVAREFHAGGPASAGSFVAVNCAAIPENIAERLLFGAKRGAYSGAEDADGYLKAAHGGTLFLDEVAELPGPVQAKLLRALETKEVVPLGAARGHRVDLRVCSATHKPLRGEVSAGRFRLDLFYRLGVPAVTIPPLRARPDEIVRMIAAEVARVTPPIVIGTSFVQECLVRRWPGNVRELRIEARAAALLAAAAGEPVNASHLAPSAGDTLEGAPPARPAAPAPRPVEDDPHRERIEAALKEQQGNVTAAARALGMHRNQLRRWLARRERDRGQG
jgi:transcriptional regulator with PAS, ATPase and Fis domain